MHDKSELTLEVEIINWLLENRNAVFICKDKRTNYFAILFITQYGHWKFVDFNSEAKSKGLMHAAVGHAEPIINKRKTFTFTFLCFGIFCTLEQFCDSLNDCEHEWGEDYDSYKNCTQHNLTKCTRLTTHLEEKSLSDLLKNLTIEY